MRILFTLPGMHRVHRGAEVALGSVAAAIAAQGDDEVTMWGSGRPLHDPGYRWRASAVVGRERFERAPHFPPLRTEYAYEDAQFAARLALEYRPDDFDVTVTCSYPFTNWALTRRRGRSRRRPAHVFVTQNGDWPAWSDDREYRWFDCDGLVCTNPDFIERNAARWRCTLVPNGVDVDRFTPGPGARDRFGLDESAFVVLVVAALVPTKRVETAVRAAARLPDAAVVVAGDGPLRHDIDRLADDLMPGRFRRLTLPAAEMPLLYRSADVLLHPALYESFGNIYVEALATGLPIVAHDYSVTRWILGDAPGLVDATDVDQVEDALRTVARDPSPAALEAGVRRAREEFAWSVIGRSYRDFFAEIVSAHAMAAR